METSYDVRIWKMEVYRGTRTTSHRVRWSVAGRRWRETFKTAALAEAFRSELVTAARRGEAFGVESGRPVSMERAQRRVSWFDFAREYAVMKWPHLAPNSRRNTARALTNATLAMVTADRGRPPDDDLRKALTAWSFNRADQRVRAPPAEVARALTWLGRNTREVGDLAQPAVVRSVLDALTLRVDGTTAARGTVQRQRGVLVNLAEYAVERGAARHTTRSTALRVEGAADREGGGPAGRRQPGAGSGAARRGGRAEAERAVAGGVLRGHVLRGAAARRGGDAAEGEPRCCRRRAGASCCWSRRPRRPARRGPTAAGAGRSASSSTGPRARRGSSPARRS